MSDTEEIPQLDFADSKITAGVASLVKRVQEQGDPLLTLRLDSLFEVGDPKEKMEKLQIIIAEVDWKE